MAPEEKARQIIDRKLEDAGWVIQDRQEFNPIASLGVAVREYLTSDNEEVDYALFIEGTPVGVIEAKPNNATSLIRHLDFFAFHLSIPYMKKVTTLILTR